MAVPSLRLKLTLWFMALFTTIYVGVLACSWILQRETTRRALNARQQGLAAGMASWIQENGHLPDVDDLRRLQPIDRRYTIVALRDSLGQVLVSRPGLDTKSMPLQRGQSLAAQPPVHITRHTFVNPLAGFPVEVRILTQRIDLARGTTGYVDIISTETLHVLPELKDSLVVLGALLGALLASASVVWVLAGRAVLPLVQMKNAMKGLNPEQMADRLTVDSTEIEVAQLQLELNEALERLEQGYRTMERFIGIVAHDLKTPVAVMLAESQVVDLKNASPEKIEAYRKSIVEESRRLNGIVEGFLALARSDQLEKLGRLTKLFIPDLILETVERCTAQAQYAGVHLVPLFEDAGNDPEMEVEGDRDLLLTMLENLVRNAIHHAPRGSTVELHTEKESGHALIGVRDHGPGIEPEHLDKIFERFFRGTQKAEYAQAGLGLGLTIVRSVVESHGGSVSARNCDDGGCEFTVILPVLDSKKATAVP